MKLHGRYAIPVENVTAAATSSRSAVGSLASTIEEIRAVVVMVDVVF
jgi:hypothetical protein